MVAETWLADRDGVVGRVAIRGRIGKRPSPCRRWVGDEWWECLALGRAALVHTTGIDSVREQRVSHTLSDGIYREERLLSAQRMVGWWLGLSRITGNASCQS